MCIYREEPSSTTNNPRKSAGMKHLYNILTKPDTYLVAGSFDVKKKKLCRKSDTILVSSSLVVGELYGWVEH